MLDIIRPERHAMRQLHGGTMQPLTVPQQRIVVPADSVFSLALACVVNCLQICNEISPSQARRMQHDIQTGDVWQPGYSMT
ncbi:hypothetical protein ACFFLM_21190 [Deinococcus oregonensis]|uniref:Uncharacterized protein n=1 Tax=Deinococcus oregonensis TaxID=1805970 RepID=A0ABV6B6E3_9DEIO